MFNIWRSSARCSEANEIGARNIWNWILGFWWSVLCCFRFWWPQGYYEFESQKNRIMKTKTQVNIWILLVKSNKNSDSFKLKKEQLFFFFSVNFCWVWYYIWLKLWKIENYLLILFIIKHQDRGLNFVSKYNLKNIIKKITISTKLTITRESKSNSNFDWPCFHFFL